MSQRSNLRPRSACSRCHAQKLKCPDRSSEDESCARCVKAGAPCVFGLSVRGLPPSLVSETGIRTAKDMDADVVTRRRTKRSRQGNPIPFPVIGPRPDLAMTNDTEILSERFDDGFDLGSQFDFDQMISVESVAGSANLGIANTEPVHSQHALLQALHPPKLSFTDPTMDYFDSQRNEAELALTHQPQNFLQSAFGSVSPWENISQHIPSEVSSEHDHAAEIWPSPKYLTKTTEDLTKLLLNLHQHAAALDRVITSYGPQPGQENQTHQGDGEKFAVDDTFRFTQTMIDIIESLFKTESEGDNGSLLPPTGVTFESGGLLHGGNASSHHPGDMAIAEQIPEQPARQSVGEPTFHLVISCWLRLGAIYNTIFGHIKTCIETRTAPTTTDGRPVSLPNVRIGSFQMPFTTTVTLQMFASLGMGSKLLHCMLGLVDNIEAGQRWNQGQKPIIQSNGVPNQQPDVFEVICKDIRYRANVLYQKLHTTRDILIRSGII